MFLNMIGHLSDHVKAEATFGQGLGEPKNAMIGPLIKLECGRNLTLAQSIRVKKGIVAQHVMLAGNDVAEGKRRQSRRK